MATMRAGSGRPFAGEDVVDTDLCQAGDRKAMVGEIVFAPRPSLPNIPPLPVKIFKRRPTEPVL